MKKTVNPSLVAVSWPPPSQMVKKVLFPGLEDLQRSQDVAVTLAKEIEALAESSIVRSISEQEFQTILVAIKASFNG